MPAKYLICRRIPCDLELSTATIDDLWIEHRTLTNQFLQLWDEVRSEKVNVSDLTVHDSSLLDLTVELAQRMLAKCNFCEWHCKVNRSEVTKLGTCQLESTSRVSTYFHHRGEEIIYRGTEGSGTIFFTSCNMRCAFCQNGDISKDKGNGTIITPEQLAQTAWLLRMEGCHNINFVGGEPTIHLHTIMKAIKLLGNVPSERDLFSIIPMKADVVIPYDINPDRVKYNREEFNAPLLWNSNFYMSEETMTLLRPVIDIWLPDFKFGPGKCAVHLSRTPKYWKTVTRNHLMIYKWKEDFSIRHLIMPNHVECCTKPVLDWINEKIPGTHVNIMDQYHPDFFTNPRTPDYNPKYEDISRFPTREEVLEAFRYAKTLNVNFEPLTFEKNMTGLRI
jgi:putative pyruvate formate lyase activating enzyme